MINETSNINHVHHITTNEQDVDQTTTIFRQNNALQHLLIFLDEITFSIDNKRLF